MFRLLSFLVTIASVFSVNNYNPFVQTPNYYVNPAYQAELYLSIATATGSTKTTLQSMVNIASAYWIDVKSKVNGNTTDTLEGILLDASKKSTKQLVTIIVYDLPNRDCHAKASNGEICCTYNADRTCNYDVAGDCAAGLNEYQTQYIDPMFSVLQKYQDVVEIVLIVEPDSLPNLATNLGDLHCGNSATQTSYKAGVQYTVNKFKPLRLTMYLDAGHGGWLGWEDNMRKFASLIISMNITSGLRGFATNTANYQPVGTLCPWASSDGYRNDYCLNGQHQSDLCCADPCSLETQYNPGNNEINYAYSLQQCFIKDAGFVAHMIIDTGRNGVANMRTDCSNWCNARGAGVGKAPTAATGQSAFLDAFHWLKTPGESDGCTQTLPDGSQCKRFDTFCGSVDSIGSQSGEPRAPEAGQWFDYQIKQLAANAKI